MDERSYKAQLIKLYGRLLLGIMGIAGLFVYSHYFGGVTFQQLKMIQKIGLVAILLYGVLWVLYMIKWAGTKKAKEFERYYRKRKIKKRNLKRKLKNPGL